MYGLIHYSFERSTLNSFTFKWIIINFSQVTCNSIQCLQCRNKTNKNIATSLHYLACNWVFRSNYVRWIFSIVDIVYLYIRYIFSREKKNVMINHCFLFYNKNYKSPTTKMIYLLWRRITYIIHYMYHRHSATAFIYYTFYRAPPPTPNHIYGFKKI